MARAKTKSWKMDWYGSDELLRGIRDMGGNVEHAISKGVEAAFVAVKKDLHQFTGYQHIITGNTEEAFTDADYYKWTKKHRLNVMVGYNVKEGGEAAIFLQVGTPKMPPYFFLTHSYHEHEDAIIRAQEKAVKDEYDKMIAKVAKAKKE